MSSFTAFLAVCCHTLCNDSCIQRITLSELEFLCKCIKFSQNSVIYCKDLGMVLVFCLLIPRTSYSNHILHAIQPHPHQRRRSRLRKNLHHSFEECIYHHSFPRICSVPTLVQMKMWTISEACWWQEIRHLWIYIRHCTVTYTGSWETFLEMNDLIL